MTPTRVGIDPQRSSRPAASNSPVVASITAGAGTDENTIVGPFPAQANAFTGAMNAIRVGSTIYNEDRQKAQADPTLDGGFAVVTAVNGADPQNPDSVELDRAITGQSAGDTIMYYPQDMEWVSAGQTYIPSTKMESFRTSAYTSMFSLLRAWPHQGL